MIESLEGKLAEQIEANRLLQTTPAQNNHHSVSTGNSDWEIKYQTMVSTYESKLTETSEIAINESKLKMELNLLKEKYNDLSKKFEERIIISR